MVGAVDSLQNQENKDAGFLRRNWMLTSRWSSKEREGIMKKTVPFFLHSSRQKGEYALRGGLTVLKEDEEEEDEEEESSFDDDSRSIGLPPVVVETWKNTPPVTKTFLSLSLLCTVLSNIFNNNNFPKLLQMNFKSMIERFQIWRPLTAFLFLGPLGLGYILTLQFLWMYMGQIEKLYYDSPEKFISMLFFGMANLLVGFGILNIPTESLGHNLSTYFVYIWSRLFEGVEVNLMNVVTVQAEVLPWIFCLQSIILERTFPLADLLGISIGHLYLYAEKEDWRVISIMSSYIQGLLKPGFRSMYKKFEFDFDAAP